tara:strand:- start:12721 stop:13614 length:894 start_codon:yes stop_codon:yes gene_type:complete
MHFDLVDMKLFIHVAEASSLSGGARRAHISTAAASTRIKLFEGQVGVRLFYRGSKGVELTPLGERMLIHARSLMKQVDNIKNDFSGCLKNEIGHIRVFANSTAATGFIPDVLREFLILRPGTTIDLQERSTHDILRSVLTGEADIGVTAGDIDEIKGLEVMPFAVDKMVAVVPENHELTAESAVAFKKTLAYQHISFHQGSTLLRFLEERALEIGETLPLRVQVYSCDSACRMVGSGVGIAVLPESSVIRYQGDHDFQIIPIEDSWAVRQRFIAVREIELLSPSAKALIDKIFEFHR